MSNLGKLITQFYRDRNLDDLINPEIAMGPGTIAFSSADKSAFMERLKDRSQLANVMLWILLLMYVVLFSMAIIVLWNSRNDMPLFISSLGGLFLSSTGIVFGLRVFWKTKSSYDLLAATIPSLPSDEVVKLLSIILSEDKNNRSTDNLV